MPRTGTLFRSASDGPTAPVVVLAPFPRGGPARRRAARVARRRPRRRRPAIVHPLLGIGRNACDLGKPFWTNEGWICRSRSVVPVMRPPVRGQRPTRPIAPTTRSDSSRFPRFLRRPCRDRARATDRCAPRDRFRATGTRGFGATRRARRLRAWERDTAGAISRDRRRRIVRRAKSIPADRARGLSRRANHLEVAGVRRSAGARRAHRRPRKVVSRSDGGSFRQSGL